jgi:hypothetical protein
MVHLHLVQQLAAHGFAHAEWYVRHDVTARVLSARLAFNTYGGSDDMIKAAALLLVFQPRPWSLEN